MSRPCPALILGVAAPVLVTAVGVEVVAWVLTSVRLAALAVLLGALSVVLWRRWVG